MRNLVEQDHGELRGTMNKFLHKQDFHSVELCQLIKVLSTLAQRPGESQVETD